MKRFFEPLPLRFHKTRLNIYLDEKLTLIMKQLWISIALVILFLTSLSAQRKRRYSPFRAGVSVGLNAGQIDGDAYRGYRKFGLQVGIQGLVVLTERFYVSTEILLSQRGARPSNKERSESFENYIDIRLGYIEVPILLNWKMGKEEEATHYSWEIFGGASIGRLTQTKVKTFGTSDVFYPYIDLGTVSEDFNPTDVSLLFGLQRNLNNNFGLFFKHSISLRNLYTPTERESPFSELQPYHVTLGVSYVIN